MLVGLRQLTRPSSLLPLASLVSPLLLPPSTPRQVVNLVTNRLVKVIGQVESSERFLRIALYQVSLLAGLGSLLDGCLTGWLGRRGRWALPTAPRARPLPVPTTHPPPLPPQGIPKRSKRLPAGPDAKLAAPDPTLLCCAYGKPRLYLFTRCARLRA